MKTCNKCGEPKPQTEFARHGRSPDGLAWECKSCYQRATNGYWTSAKRRAAKRKRRRRNKSEFVERYGGACDCCGETRIEFLTADHEGGGGTAHRRKIGFGSGELYRWLRRRGYPEYVEIEGKTVRIRLLCWNCNCALGNYGYCPHDEPERHLKEFPLAQKRMFEND